MTCDAKSERQRSSDCARVRAKRKQPAQGRLLLMNRRRGDAGSGGRAYMPPRCRAAPIVPKWSGRVALSRFTRQRDLALPQDRRGVQTNILLLQTGRRSLHALELVADIAISVGLGEARIAVCRVRILALRECRGAGDCEQRRSECSLVLGHCKS